jgi:HEAT repeat protein
LGQLGPDAVAAIASLIRSLEDLDPVVRRNAGFALGHIGPKAEAAVPGLTKLVTSKEPEEVRMSAAEALKLISPSIRKAVPVLVRVLKEDSNCRVRTSTVLALAKVANADTELAATIYPALTAVLSETDAEMNPVRYTSAMALGLFQGPQAPDKVVDLLLALLKDENIQRYGGSSAKVTSAGSESRAADASLTANYSGDCREQAAWALARIGRKANKPEIIRILKEAAQSSDAAVRAAAKEALRKIQG